jgi:hypothetical protein
MKEKKSRSSTVPTSDGLKDSESRSTDIIEEQLSWSSEKMIFILSISVFLNIIFGPTLHYLDVYTEKFSEELINIPQDRDACKQYFDNEFNKVILECKTMPNKENCMDKIAKIEKIGKACFESESTAEN